MACDDLVGIERRLAAIKSELQQGVAENVIQELQSETNVLKCCARELTAYIADIDKGNTNTSSWIGIGFDFTLTPPTAQ